MPLFQETRWVWFLAIGSNCQSCHGCGDDEQAARLHQHAAQSNLESYADQCYDCGIDVSGPVAHILSRCDECWDGGRIAAAVDEQFTCGISSGAIEAEGIELS